MRHFFLRSFPVRRDLKIAVLLCLWCACATAGFGQAAGSSKATDVVIKNAIVMTVTHGNIKNGSIYIKDGKIAAVGESVNAPAGATVIDAGGKYVTPGIVDSHSHIALDDDVNEATSPITPQMMMKDAFDYQDKAIYRALAGGVTTSLLLHGSATMIGGSRTDGGAPPATTPRIRRNFWLTGLPLPPKSGSATERAWPAGSSTMAVRTIRLTPIFGA